ncbi:hypothetical protein ABTC91_19855, partial [Acinetobacter baumannii]
PPPPPHDKHKTAPAIPPCVPGVPTGALPLYDDRGRSGGRGRGRSRRDDDDRSEERRVGAECGGGSVDLGGRRVIERGGG